MTQLHADVTRFLNDRLDWNLLRTFLVIMQERSVSRAAARLHLTQPAVSQALKRLEDTLGRNLIQRRGPHFEPTRAGEEVYRIASDIYGHMSRLETELDDRSDDITGSIRLLTVSRIDSGVYDEFLAEFHKTYPRVDLQIEVMRSSDIISSLLQKTATAGLGLCRTPVDKLEQRCFLRQRYALFCGRHHRSISCSRKTSCRSPATRSATVSRRSPCFAINAALPDVSWRLHRASTKCVG
jgi:DNA-binding transcriptional LysR family regulator